MTGEVEPAHNKNVAAFARFTRSGEHGAGAPAPATSERYKKSAVAKRFGVLEKDTALLLPKLWAARMGEIQTRERNRPSNPRGYGPLAILN